MGFRMVDDQVPFRRLARAALDRWFDQLEVPPDERTPVRERRRLAEIAVVLEPVRGRMSDEAVDRLTHALGVILGTDSMLALTDGVGLEGDDAKAAMLDAGRWLLAGALAELDADVAADPDAPA